MFILDKHQINLQHAVCINRLRQLGYFWQLNSLAYITQRWADIQTCYYMSKSASENVYLDTNCAWSENRSACCILLFCMLPHSVAALECSQVKQQLHNKTKQQTDGLTDCLSLSSCSLSVCLSAPFAYIFILKITQVADRQQGAAWRVFCVAISTLAKTKAESKQTRDCTKAA